jgi:predicted nuclease of predicted toxin-antitoxin system
VKFLLDNCVSRPVYYLLMGLGQDVVRVADWEDDPDDSEVLRRSAGDKRILVTLDKDFGRLVEVERLAHSGVIRLREQRPSYQVETIHY